MCIYDSLINRMSKIIKTAEDGVYKLIFDRVPKHNTKEYSCTLSKHEHMPRVLSSHKYRIEEGNNISQSYITFALCGNIAPYNEYYQYSTIDFDMTHDGRKDADGHWHSLYDYYFSNFAHYYRMPIISQSQTSIQTKTTSILIK